MHLIVRSLKKKYVKNVAKIYKKIVFINSKSKYSMHGSKIEKKSAKDISKYFSFHFVLISDCTHGGKNAKNHCTCVHSHADNNMNNNTTNVNNNQTAKRQYSISEDGATISEDDLDNLINQKITEWQQRQKSNNENDKIDIDLIQSASIIS